MKLESWRKSGRGAVERPVRWGPAPTAPSAASALAGLAVLVSGMILVSGCGPGGGAAPPEPVVEVSVARPEVTTVEDVVPAVGSVEAQERVVLQPEVPGLIESIHFEEGQLVRKGDVLFRMRSRKEEAQLAQARADQGLAKSNLERARTLAGSKAISQQEIDQMESTLEARVATFELESRRLEERVVTAPFDGRVGPRDVSVGQYVNAGMPLVTLVQDARVKVGFRLPERLLGSLRPGQAGRLTVTAYPGQSFEGEVDLVNPEVDVATRTVEGRLRVPNPDGRLRPGMFARVELVLGRRNDALVVPESALVPSLEDFAVFVIEDGRARLKPVKLGVRLPGKVELRAGVPASATVIVSGTQKLVDGSMVQPGMDRAVTAAAPAAPAVAPAKAVAAEGAGAGPAVSPTETPSTARSN